MPLLSKMIRGMRTNRVAPYIRGSVLDLGCGDAVILRLFSKKIESYCGVEYDPKRVEELKQSFPKHEFYRKNLDEDNFDLRGKFDAVLLIAVIEHIFNQKHLCQQILKHLNHGGQIIVTTPTPWGDLIHRLGSRVGLFAKSADDHHIVIYDKRRFRVLADAFQLKIIKYQRFALGCNQLVVLGRKKEEQSSNHS